VETGKVNQARPSLLTFNQFKRKNVGRRRAAASSAIDPTTWQVRSIVNDPEGCFVSVNLSLNLQVPVVSVPFDATLTGQAKLG
jgi:hypothetical protein